MSDSRPMLEYAFTEPETYDDVPFSLAKFLAMGYIAACTFGLILMGIIMAMQV
jgi:hypothetical protein